jgi:hypothetical protein
MVHPTEVGCQSTSHRVLPRLCLSIAIPHFVPRIVGTPYFLFISLCSALHLDSISDCEGIFLHLRLFSFGKSLTYFCLASSNQALLEHQQKVEMQNYIKDVQKDIAAVSSVTATKMMPKKPRVRNSTACCACRDRRIRVSFSPRIGPKRSKHGILTILAG